MTRRSLGLAAMVVGAVMVLAGIGGLLSRAGAPSSAVAEDDPAQSDEAEPPPPSPASESSVAEAPEEDPPDAEAIVRSFVAELERAVSGGDDPGFLFASLHPAVLDLYGAPACRRAMRIFEDPTFRITVRRVGSLEPWDWEIDDRSIPVADVYPVAITRVLNGERAAAEIHLGAVGDDIRWFTDCGDPLV